MPLCLRPELSSQRIDRQGLSQGGAAHASTGGQGRQSVLQLLCHAGDQSAEDYRPPDAVSDRADYHGVWPPTAPGVRANAERALPRLGGSLTPRSAARIEHNGLVVYQRRSATGGQCRDLGRQSEMTQHSLGRGNASPRGGVRLAVPVFRSPRTPLVVPIPRQVLGRLLDGRISWPLGKTRLCMNSSAARNTIAS